ncbi:thioredoxin family protein [Caldibacillus thermoamylovorans]|uniref:thioredoxin family protein n=1 Tax=Caldibacillus thermoamylovorans TaxID=35841 RepID=UPI001D088561|nr:thioredoxin family protein [Caldibacillus thermoamylovorans]MCB5934925.1 thioredoxin family protein [Bacillus sp. DFI.2.34]MCB7077888.1 thioredoxin family protein [Caldibacillus thermoamylovorans]
MEKLQSVEQFESLKNSGSHVFLFTAGWCPDCRFLEPFFPEIENEYKEYTFVSVDRDEFIDLCGELDIFGIPSFVVFKDGQEIGRFVSKDRKTKEEVEKFMDSLK